MANQIIARGELKQYYDEERCYFLDDKERQRRFAISCDLHSASLLKSLIGETLIIAIEEKEKELIRDKIINAALELAGA